MDAFNIVAGIASIASQVEMDALNFVAGIASIASLVITVFTLVITTRIHKYVNQSDYRKNIKEYIDVFLGCCATLRNDRDVINDSLFDDIWEKLDAIDIYYEDVLGKKLIRKIRNLKEYMLSEEARNAANYGEDARRLSSLAKELQKQESKF